MMGGEWRGPFEVEGHHVTLALAPDGWLVATTPVAGSPDLLLERQAGLPGLAKVALGPVLLAEMPAATPQEEDFRALMDAMRTGLNVLGDSRTSDLPPGTVGEVAEALAAYASSCPWEWTETDSRWTFRVASPGGRQRIVGEAIQGAARLASTLVSLENAKPVSRRALSHFLMALNGCLRLARGTLTEKAAVLEVILPTKGQGASLIERAVGALIVGFAAARRESAALLDPELAGAYCSFHLVFAPARKNQN